jgi:hypothetical protein
MGLGGTIKIQFSQIVCLSKNGKSKYAIRYGPKYSVGSKRQISAFSCDRLYVFFENLLIIPQFI